jgi:hypothetical protein
MGITAQMDNQKLKAIIFPANLDLAKTGQFHHICYCGIWWMDGWVAIWIGERLGLVWLGFSVGHSGHLLAICWCAGAVCQQAGQKRGKCVGRGVAEANLNNGTRDFWGASISSERRGNFNIFS